MPSPENVTQLRQVLGMVNYLGKFLPGLSSELHPVSELLKKDTEWLWEEPQQRAFTKVKSMLSSAPALAYYDVGRPTIVSADASSYGLGAALLQVQGDKVKPVAFCSRTLTDAEKRYSQLEKECLATVWACERFSCYLQGLAEFCLQTDHKPLVPLINAYDLDKVPLRCQRLLMRLMRFNPRAVHVPGAQLVVADTLSRNPLRDSSGADTEDDVRAYVEAVIKTRAMSSSKLDLIRKATRDDGAMQRVVGYTREGWPRYVPFELQGYYSARTSLSEADGLLLYQDRIVIPPAHQEDILNRIHEGHQGLSKCRERANMSVWWPSIGTDIHRKIGADLCEQDGKNYLVVVDYYSRDIEIAQLQTTSSHQVINRLKGMFVRWGIPRELISDNATQFTSAEFKQFSRDYDFNHTTSSPHFPQANGAAERAVGTAKRILRQPDPHLALMCYRATPIAATGASPAQLMTGRRIRTTVPVLEKKLKPQLISHKEVERNDRKAKEVYKFFYDRRYSARALPELHPGESVHIKLDGQKGWNTPAVVVNPSGEPRSYTVRTEDGTVFRRNRRHLQSVPAPTTAAAHTTAITDPVRDSTDSQQEQLYLTVTNSPGAPTETGPPANLSGVRTTSSGRVVKTPQRYRV
ncbi:hypothetical protein SKAU_G00282710 [Synaphobranchus kaupii]|uniref:Gypsy retrotransposon integrase-like protein 1 n=1 Tax=Synaphobranchus kaupii TaxID=118154 RepID=A0A9Q1IP41_SYNKA|nr:hypothetical protein SKAU_G00282710 [Synaphobranchus kaupii]